eukprot:SAG31_NODE_3157_length_4610_cov_8.242740_4_plen_109_part_00
MLPTFTPMNDSDLAALAAARAHLTMWAMLKSPILLVRCETVVLQSYAHFSMTLPSSKGSNQECFELETEGQRSGIYVQRHPRRALQSGNIGHITGQVGSASTAGGQCK